MVTGAHTVEDNAGGGHRTVFSVEEWVADERVASSQQRFSRFVQLVHEMQRELGGQRRADASAARRQLDRWSARLAIERRHTGSQARSPQVVTARIKLLQQLLDELCAVPELRASAHLTSLARV